MNIAEKIARAKMDCDEVYEAGKKAEYDAFWDNYQDYGSRVVYQYAFAGTGWTKDTLKPKYKVTIVETSSSNNYASSMFYRCNGESSADNAIDFNLIADKFDFIGVKRASNMFDSANIKNLYADLTNCEFANYTFASQWGGGVDNVTLKVTDKLINTDYMFLYNSSLKEIRFTDDSEIATTINFQWSTRLSKASITSIINALSSTTSGLTVTISKTAKEAAFTAEEWNALIATKPNWTISLV